MPVASDLSGPPAQADLAVIGGGIVGLATALAAVRRQPGTSVAVIEKEPALAAHQTGRNSGVVHSGIYYAPGSLKAEMCRRGNSSMVEFCREHGIPVEICGKLIVATDRDELPRLERLAERAEAHGLAYERLGPDGLRDREPEVAGIAGLWVPSTGITDYVAVARRYAELIVEAGGSVTTGTEVTALDRSSDGWRLTTPAGVVAARRIVNCGGLHSDRLARRAGTRLEAQIVPFRGEYYELRPSAHHLVRGLIYPVPDPAFPFLGVHLTKMIHGGVHAGPNAVLALAREGYRRRDLDLGDLAETLRYPGFRKLARKHLRTGAAEVARSFSKRLFLRSLQRLVPALELDDLTPSASGIRAQALTAAGGLVDDFLIVSGDDAVHVGNAPSPAATSSLEIGIAIFDHVAR